jgi:CheY-like chemotaxis protein
MRDIIDKRVLIVEDNSLIGEVIAETISDAGGWPIGPVLTEIEALDMINYDNHAPDAAVIDIGLDGRSFGVASRLRELGVPFVFATGYAQDIPAEFDDAPVCEKPYTPHALLTALQSVIVPTAAAA